MLINTQHGRFDLTLQRCPEGSLCAQVVALEPTTTGDTTMTMEVFDHTTVGDVLGMGEYMAEMLCTDLATAKWEPMQD